MSAKPFSSNHSLRFWLLLLLLSSDRLKEPYKSEVPSHNRSWIKLQVELHSVFAKFLKFPPFLYCVYANLRHCYKEEREWHKHIQEYSSKKYCNFLTLSNAIPVNSEVIRNDNVHVA